MNKRVIVAEDDASIREVLEMYLEIKGWTVEFATEGKEALALIKKSIQENNPYDALITDINMPHGMGGIELITNLITNPEYSGFKRPIIAMSGHLDNQKKVCSVCKDIVFLEKPVQPLDKLIETVERLCIYKPICNKGAA